MRISKEDLEEFKKIYVKEFGKTISDADALESATKLLRLMELVYKPITQKDMDMITERRRQTQPD